MKLIDNEIIKSIVDYGKLDKTDILILEKNITEELIRNVYDADKDLVLQIFGEFISIRKVQVPTNVNLYALGIFQGDCIEYYYKDKKEKISINTIIHELMHLFIYNINSYMDAVEEERLVQQLTNALLYQFYGSKNNVR